MKQNALIEMACILGNPFIAHQMKWNYENVN